MTKRMLIDAAHPEETRVVVLDGNKLEDFDYESSSRQNLKGNIYLGKITRVEPSLQAAFVEYGGNRHGFLPFGDIHPDYYRIPIADREALIAQEAEDSNGDSGSDHHEDSKPARSRRHRSRRASSDHSEHEEAEHESDHEDSSRDRDSGESGYDESDHDERSPELSARANGHDRIESDAESDTVDAHEHSDHDEEDTIETVGGDEIEPPRNFNRMRRSYKIQEVIKRRQIVLIQVTKEERGNKGAALTTFVSLAGRYCVLMPNAVRGGGISRKITNLKDRRRLKDVIDSLELPTGMAVILRTAGMERNKTEIRRDYEFLSRIWDEIREKTFSSRAPALIYEEANLIKRTIRDSYSRDIDEILVEGEEAYRTAKAFMRALMPSHAKRVQLYKDRSVHLFPSLQVESQLDALHAPTVRLKSGGYIVINPTEALVAIDVNSGRATRERHIEETALRTNLEAASEIARQLRLRDLAGLIVIDFIDMEDRRNNAAVERRLKEAMRVDRARVQIGRISQLGLLELSRQRLRPSLLETSMQVCAHCDGRGLTRTVESTALHVLRAMEEEAVRHRSAEVVVYVTTSVALFLLNQKREGLRELELQQGMRVVIERDDTLVSPAYRIDQVRAMTREEEARMPVVEAVAEPVIAEAFAAEHEEEEPEEIEERAAAPVPEQPESGDAGADGDRPRRRRRGRRGGRRRGKGRDDMEAAEGIGADEQDGAFGPDDSGPDDSGSDDSSPDDANPDYAGPDDSHLDDPRLADPGLDSNGPPSEWSMELPDMRSAPFGAAESGIESSEAHDPGFSLGEPTEVDPVTALPTAEIAPADLVDPEPGLPEIERRLPEFDNSPEPSRELEPSSETVMVETGISEAPVPTAEVAPADLVDIAAAEAAAPLVDIAAAEAAAPHAGTNGLDAQRDSGPDQPVEDEAPLAATIPEDATEAEPSAGNGEETHPPLGTAEEAEPEPMPIETETGPRRRGWWQRLIE